MAALDFCEEEMGFLRLLLLDTPTPEDTRNEEYFPGFLPGSSSSAQPVVYTGTSLAATQDLFSDHMQTPLDTADAALWNANELGTNGAEIGHTDVGIESTAERQYADHKCCRLASRRCAAHQTSGRSNKDAQKARLCSAPNCQKSSQSRGRCIRHGGGKRCSVENCTRGAQATGRCKAHGGGIRCSVDGCSKSSQGSGLCRTHGGGKICVFPGCKKGTQRRGRCSAHGGSRRCTVDGCGKIDRGGGFCESHKKTLAMSIPNASIVLRNS